MGRKASPLHCHIAPEMFCQPHLALNSDGFCVLFIQCKEKHKMNVWVFKIKLESNHISNSAFTGLSVPIKEVQPLWGISGSLGFPCLGCVYPRFLQGSSLFSGIRLSFLHAENISLFREPFQVWALDREEIGQVASVPSVPQRVTLPFTSLAPGGSGVASQGSRCRRCSCPRFCSCLTCFTFDVHTSMVNNMVLCAGRAEDHGPRALASFPSSLQRLKLGERL